MSAANPTKHLNIFVLWLRFYGSDENPLHKHYNWISPRERAVAVALGLPQGISLVGDREVAFLFDEKG